jgi:fumarate hydratase class II
MTVSGTALAALSQAQQRVDQAAEGVRKATAPATALHDQLDLSTEAVGLLAAKIGYDSAIGLARAADEISRTTLDLLA